MSEDRADIIIPAAIAFYCICRQVNATSFILSRKGLREGIVSEHIYQKYENYLSPHVLEDSINELVMDYNVNKEQINQVLFLADKLIHELQRFKLITLTDEDIKFFKMAAHVFHLGQYIDSESSAQHTFYLLANRTIDGLMHKDRVKLAIIASFKNRHLFKQFFKPFCKWFENKKNKSYFY